jgi:hypothetical protein
MPSHASADLTRVLGTSSWGLSWKMLERLKLMDLSLAVSQEE